MREIQQRQTRYFLQYTSSAIERRLVDLPPSLELRIHPTHQSDFSFYKGDRIFRRGPKTLFFRDRRQPLIQRNRKTVNAERICVKGILTALFEKDQSLFFLSSNRSFTANRTILTVRLQYNPNKRCSKSNEAIESPNPNVVAKQDKEGKAPPLMT